MPRAKTWAELTRRQRREVRAFLRVEIEHHGKGVAYSNRVPSKAVLRAALKQLSEPKREADHD